MKTSTVLEEEFNMAPSSELEVIPEKEELSLVVTEAKYKELDNIERALSEVRGLDSGDDELDKLADLAISSHNDLIELSLNCEQRLCGEIASVASSFLASAITAKTNKIKSKLDRIALQIKKQIADQKIKTSDEKIPLDGESQILDRNELLAHLLKNSNLEK
jgi:hypothetical protein